MKAAATPPRGRGGSIRLLLGAALCALVLVPTADARACADVSYDPATCERTHHSGAFALAGAGVAAAVTVVTRTRTTPRRPGPRPDFKKPRDYDGRENVWDPSIARQEEMWDRRGVVWDEESLSWRDPVADDFPPPSEEVKTPFSARMPRSEVPFKCLGLYDQYTRAQQEVLELNERIPLAVQEYQHAVDEFGKQYLKAMLRLGYDVGSTVSAAGGGLGARPGQAGLGPRDMWLGSHDKLQRMLRDASQAAAQAAENAAKIALEVAEAARDALARSKAVTRMKEGLDAAKGRIRDLRGTARAAEESVKSLEAKEAAAKQLRALEAEKQKVAYEALSTQEKYDAIDAYIEKLEEMNATYSEFVVVNSRLVNATELHERLLLDLEGKKRILHLDPSVADDIARLEAEAAEKAAEIVELRKTARSVEEWVEKMKAFHESLKENPAYRSALADADTSQASVQALRKERLRLGTELNEISREEARIQAQLEGFAGTVDGAPLDVIQANLEQDRAALRESLDAISDEERRLARLETEVPGASLEAEAAARAVQAKEDALKAAQQAVEDAKRNVEAVGAEIAHLGPPPAPGEAVTPDVLAKLGQAWVSAFGADQSGAEMGQVLVQIQTAVSERKARVDALEAERASMLQQMRESKPRLDACVEEHAAREEAE